MTAWNAEGADIRGDLLAARKRIEENPAYPPEAPYVVHPRQHAHACRLLGRPEGSPLTNRDLEEAAAIELDQLDPEARAKVLDELARILFPW